MKLATALPACALTVVALYALPVQAEDRAQTLHDTYCRACHGPEVYTRQNRLANDFAGVRAQVKLWQGNAGLHWSDADIDAVAADLATRYYKVPCPASC